jgi:hypothetical protein
MQNPLNNFENGLGLGSGLILGLKKRCKKRGDFFLFLGLPCYLLKDMEQTEVPHESQRKWQTKQNVTVILLNAII